MKIRFTVPDSVNAKLKGYISRGIAALEVNDEGHLILTLTDGAVVDLGKVSGDDGVSCTHEWDGTVLRVTSASGTSEADLKGRDGRDGRDGIDGKDGYTPIKGVDYFDGKNGVDGKDGYTPVKNVDYFDGKDGVDGKDGYTPVKGKDYFDGANGKDGVSATHTWSGTVLTMTSASGTSSADLKGERGEPGAGLSISGSVATYFDLPNDLTLADAGEAYFVEADGKLYIWSGTAWPANGEGSQFKGDKGDPGKDGYTPVKGVDYFDGEDGYTPVKGKDYFDGKDGTSATHRWNGTVLEITSASGTSSADLKGATGDAGYTPQKGVDYFDGKDGQDGYTPQKGVDYFDGKDGASGKDGVSVTHSWSGTTLTVTSASGTSSADLKGEKGDTGEVDYSRLDGYLSKSVYDPQGKAQDIFKYVDDAVSEINPDKLTKPVPVAKGGTGATTVADARTNLDVPSNTALNTAYNKIISMGEQLVVNGDGFLGNNTNFNQMTFDGAQANNSGGSFTIALGSKLTVASNEYIAVKPDRKYTFSADMKSLNGLSTFNGFLGMYDVDKLQISDRNHIYLAGSTTKLARDLVAGDTVAYVEDLSGWKLQTYRHLISVWNYKNSKGYMYPTESYTRNFIDLLAPNYTPTAETFDYVNNKITLAKAYTGETIPKGTAVSQGGIGPTYKYAFYCKPTTEWQKFSGSYDGVDYSGGNIATKFSPGTAFVKINFLWNDNGAADQTWVTNISLLSVASDKDIPKTAADLNAPTVSQMNTAIANAIGAAIEGGY